MTNVGLLLEPDVLRAMRSVRRVFEQFEDVLGRNFELIRFPADCPGDGMVESRRAFLGQVDIVVSSSPFHGDRTWMPHVPFAYVALGSFPAGAVGFLRLLSRLENIDSILYSCRSDKHILDRVFPKQEMANFHVPFAVDRSVFFPQGAGKRSELRTRYGISHSTKVLVYAGRLVRQKNIHLLLAMLEDIQRFNPDVKLILAGSADPGDPDSTAYRRELEQILERQELGTKVLFTGDVDDQGQANLFSAADIFLTCTTNRDENFGYSVVEAMACGLPVVCSHWGGLKDTVIEGKTGYFMETRLTETGVSLDIQKGVRHVIDLLSEDDRRNRMSEQCIRHIAQHYGRDCFERNLVRAIHETLARRDRITEIVCGHRFELHPMAFEILARTEYAVKEDFFSRYKNFSPADPSVDEFFLSPYSSHMT
jgi:glycosyltransferase involved in cell wall biosynthesis